MGLHGDGFKVALGTGRAALAEHLAEERQDDKATTDCDRTCRESKYPVRARLPRLRAVEYCI